LAKSLDSKGYLDKFLHIALAIWATFALATWATLALPIPEARALNADCRGVLKDRWSAPERILDFPTNVSVGTIATQPDWHKRGAASPERILPARGKIVVPINQFVTFQPNSEFLKNPKLISQLPANAIDCFELKLISMEESEDALCDKALGGIGHLKGLTVLLLDRSEVSDTGIRQIAGLTNLVYLSAFLTPLRGTFLKDLRSLKKLQALALPSIGLQEEELKYLPEYPALEHLLLSRTNLTAKGLKYIARCAKLRRLDLSKNPGVGDDCIPYIRQMKALRNLAVDDTSITFQGLLQLEGTNFTQLELTEGRYSHDQLALFHSTFPQSHILFRGGVKKIDDETGTIYGQMSRQRHF
jgi:hypothetical protein